MLLIGYCYAHAQNSSLNPYIDSWQKYTIPMGDAVNNTPEWSIEMGATSIPLTNGLTNGGNVWVRTGTEPSVSPSNAYIEIKFIDAIFNDGESWTLVFQETNDATGNCEALRSLDITISINNFYLSLGADGDDCNSLDGEVLNWNDYDNEDVESYVDFDVQMNKLDNFAMNSWSFSGSVTLLDGNYSFLRVRSEGNNLTGTSNDGQNFTITDNGGGSFSVVVSAAVTTPSDPAAAYTDFITVRVFMEGLVHEAETARLIISNGKAQSGSAYIKETDDNITLGGDRLQEIGILALPATPNIAIVN